MGSGASAASDSSGRIPHRSPGASVGVTPATPQRGHRTSAASTCSVGDPPGRHPSSRTSLFGAGPSCIRPPARLRSTPVRPVDTRSFGRHLRVWLTPARSPDTRAFGRHLFVRRGSGQHGLPGDLPMEPALVRIRPLGGGPVCCAPGGMRLPGTPTGCAASALAASACAGFPRARGRGPRAGTSRVECTARGYLETGHIQRAPSKHRPLASPRVRCAG